MFRRPILIALVAFLSLSLLLSSLITYNTGASLGGNSISVVRADNLPTPTPAPSVRTGSNGGRTFIGGGPSSGK